jgi:anti-anti-sigma regulatory factor
MIFHLHKMAIHRRIKSFHKNTEDICISINKENSKIMSIQITYKGGVYEINGLLNSQNGESLKNHLAILMDHSKGMVLSLNKVLDIDANAAKIITAMYRKAWLNDKLFYIIGMKNKKVNKVFVDLNFDEILL